MAELSAIATRVAKLLAVQPDCKTVQKIDFTIEYSPGTGGFQVNSAGFKLVAEMIWKHYIQVKVDASKCPVVTVKGVRMVTAGKYERKTAFMYFRDPNPTNAVIVHESTHAALSLTRTRPVRNFTDEVAARLAEFIFSRLEDATGPGDLVPDVGMLADEFVAAKNLAMDAGIFTTKLTGSGSFLVYHRNVTVSSQKCEPARKALEAYGYKDYDLDAETQPIKTGDAFPEHIARPKK